MAKWIRRKIMPDILEAIEATDRSVHVFYITSEGGEGKTVLLRQIGMELGSPGGIAHHERWSGILDLYHSEVNTNSGLETHMGKALQTEEKEFQPYRDQRDAYDARREAGLIGPELETERSHMAEVFAKCVNTVTRWRRVVIALDTTERIQYEVDEVQRLCGLEDENTTVRAWLLDQLRRWENCVVLLVGRPEAAPYLGEALEKTLASAPGIRYEVRTLGAFDEDDACAYFELKKSEFPSLHALDAEICHRLWEVTEGRPIRLDLTVEVIEHGLGFDRFREKVEHGEDKEIRREIDGMLIDHVMRGEPDRSVRDVLRYLAIARKGLHAELLRHLAGEWALKECQSRLDAVAERGFMKQRPRDERLYLHDEMYQLCDTYLLEPAQVQRLSQRIAGWYDAQIEAADDRDRRKDLQVDSILYRLRANPREGYHWYAQQAEYAIRSAQIGFDLRLRNEVVAFLQSPSPIDRRLLRDAPGLVEEFNCDATARWVKRLMVRGESERAVAVAEQVVDEYPGLCRPDDPGFRLARADLTVYQAQAMIYTARVGSAVHLLRGVIASLEDGHRPGELAQQEPDTYHGWRRNLVLGRGHNNLGYAYWMHLGHYGAAFKEFRAALPYFRASELQEELANTNDNMGRVWALLRHYTRAGAMVDEGLRMRRELGLEYRVALSLNSRAVVHLEFGEFEQARRLSEEALGMFEQLETQRGIGLALITLGQSLRRLGGRWASSAYSFQECDRSLGHGARHLDRAVHIFERVVSEPIRLAEALNELGSLYRERARLAQAMAPGSAFVRTISLEAIRRFDRCIELAEELGLTVWYVDSCEDLAQVYFLRREYANANTWLDAAGERVPAEYKFSVGEVPTEIPEEECVEALWLQMGKVELLSGSLAFDRATDDGPKPAIRHILEETVRHYFLSAAYFERYSNRATGLRTAFRQMYDRLKHCSFDDLRYLEKEALPAIAASYRIDLSRPGRFFEDTLGLALQWGT